MALQMVLSIPLSIPNWMQGSLAKFILALALDDDLHLL